MNRKAIALMAELRDRYEDEVSPIVISGCIGPQDDGYDPKQRLSADEAAEYHSTQIDTFADTEADMVTALTLTYVDEAIGIARAAHAAGIPAAISFTLETDGRLPSGQALSQAIEETDAATGGEPAYYMINCAHPTHFESVLGGSWTTRIRGLRANASTKSHAELDEATELDDGDPEDLGARYAQLRKQLPEMNVLGGCCGTDDRHVGRICRAWTHPRPERSGSVDQPPAHGPAAELVPVGELQLAQHRADVGLHGLHRDAEAQADLLVEVAARDVAEHLALAGGELIELGVDLLGRQVAGEGIEHEAGKPW